MILQKQLRKIQKRTRAVWVDEGRQGRKGKGGESRKVRSITPSDKLYVSSQGSTMMTQNVQRPWVSRRKLSEMNVKVKEVVKVKGKSRSIGVFLAACPEPPKKMKKQENFKELLGLVDEKDINNEKINYGLLYFKENCRIEPKKREQVIEKKITTQEDLAENQAKMPSEDPLRQSQSLTSSLFSFKSDAKKKNSEQIRNRFKKSVEMVANFLRPSRMHQPQISQFTQFSQFPQFPHRRGSIGRQGRYRSHLSTFGRNYILKTKFLLPCLTAKSQKLLFWFTSAHILFKHQVDATSLKIQLRYLFDSKPDKILINCTSEQIIALCEQLEKLNFTDFEKLQAILVNLIRSEEEEIEDGREYVRIKEYLREMVCERRANKGRIINRFNREIRKLYTHESQKVSRIVGVESGALEVNAKSRTLYWWSQNHLDQEYVFKQAMVFVIAGTATFVYRTMPTCGNQPRNLLMKKIQATYRQCANIILDKINLLACLYQKFAQNGRAKQSKFDYQIIVEKDKFEISKVLLDGNNNKFVSKNQPKLYFNQPNRQKLFELHNQYEYSFFNVKSCQFFRLGNQNLAVKGTQVRITTPNQTKFLSLNGWQDQWIYERFLLLKIQSFSSRELMKRFILLFVGKVKNICLVNQSEEASLSFHHLKKIEEKKYSVITEINKIQKTVECRFISVSNRLIKYRYIWSLSDLYWSIDYIKSNKLIYFSEEMSLETKLGLIYDRLIRDPSLTYSHLRLPYFPVPDRLIFGRKTANERISLKFCTKIKQSNYIICSYIYNGVSRIQYFHLYFQKCQKNYTRIRQQSQVQNTEGLLDEVQSEFSTKKSLLKIKDIPPDLPSFKRKKLLRRQGIRNGSIRSSLTTLDQRIKQNCVWRHARIGNQNFFLIAHVNRPMTAQTDTDNTELEVELTRSGSVVMFKWTGSLVDVLRNTLIKAEDLGKKMICTRRSVSLIAEKLVSIVRKNGGFCEGCRLEIMQLLENDRAVAIPKKYSMYLTGEILSITLSTPVQVCLLSQWQQSKDLTRNRSLTDITNTLTFDQPKPTQQRIFRRLYNRVKWYKQIGHI